MYAEAAVNVEVVFSEVATLALDPLIVPAETLLPAHFINRAHFALPGDLVQLQGVYGTFVVAQRIWTLKAGRTTLRLVLDVLVQDEA